MNIKATIDNANMSQYRFAKLLGRPKEHIWKWYHVKSTPSSLMQEKIQAMCEEQGIKIIK